VPGVFRLDRYPIEEVQAAAIVHHERYHSASMLFHAFALRLALDAAPDRLTGELK
jgi:hypothetical protein